MGQNEKKADGPSKRTIKVKGERLGKRASALTPEDAKIDPKIGFILVASLPLAVIVFWKITIPLSYFVVSTLLGADMMRKLKFVGQDFVNVMTSTCPPWITAEEMAYLEDQSYQQIQRLQDLSEDKFQELVNIGEPFVVTDAIKGSWPAYADWDCHTFFQKYPDAEYFDWQGQDQIRFADIFSRSGYEGLACASGYIETRFEANRKYEQEWLQNMPLPLYFMNNSSFPRKDSIPMSGFLGTPGTGVSPHLDETCENFMTVQLAGIKSWSLSWPYLEGSKLTWSKPLRFFLQPGDVMFWFACMRHHTEAVEGCSLSFSFKYGTPAPKAYFEKLLKDLSSVSQEDRDTLFSSTEVVDLNFLDKCSLREENGQTVIL